MNRLLGTLLIPCFMSIICRSSWGFGVDKLLAELDASKDFRSVVSLTVFNDDSPDPVMVTAQGLQWDMTDDQPFKLTPSGDIDIFPPIQKIPAGGSATFKFRYAGPPVTGESTYRVLFRSIHLPKNAGHVTDQKSDLSNDVQGAALVGLSVTVPVYVADQSMKTDPLAQVSALYDVAPQGLGITVRDHGDRRVSVTHCKIDGQDIATPLGIVLANHQRRFQLPKSLVASAHSVSLELSYHDKTQWIEAKPAH